MDLCQDWHIPSSLPQTGRRPGPGVCPRWAGRRGSGASGTLGGATGRQGHIEVSLAPFVACLSEAYLLAGRLEDARQRAVRPARSLPPVQATRQPGLGPVAPGREHGAPRSPKRSSPPQATTARPSPWPKSWVCAHSRRTATMGWAGPYGQTGRGAQARAALATAIALYRDMAMTFWLPQAEAVRAQVESAP